MTTTALFTLYRWTVTGDPNEDGNYEVLDHDGDVVDECTILEDAIDSCTQGATESYRERLWEAICDTDVDDFPTYILQAIADQLGYNAGMI